MFDQILNDLFSELLASCVYLDGVIYAPLESILSSLGAWFSVHVVILTAIAFLFWQILDLLKVLLDCIFHFVKEKYIGLRRGRERNRG